MTAFPRRLKKLVPKRIRRFFKRKKPPPPPAPPPPPPPKPQQPQPPPPPPPAPAAADPPAADADDDDGDMTSFATRPPSTKKRAAPKRSSRTDEAGGARAAVKKAAEADRPRRPSSKDAGEVPEHRKMASLLRKLEAEGKKGSGAYKELAAKHGAALHRRLKELKCDLTDAELRTLNKPDNEGEIPLHKVVYEYFALASGAKGATTSKRMDACVAKARGLCEAGAKINHKNKYGDTPLLAAAQTDSADIAKVLLEYRADLTLKNRQGYTPLLMAASENRPGAVAAIVPEMFARRLSLDALSGGYSALHWACINNAPKMVQVLLKHKANKNLGTDPDGHTPLMKAAAYNSAASVEQLLRARCDATAVDADGRTALHHAAKNKATLCVQMLIASGVPADVVDDHNQKAVFYAAVAKSKPCVTAISAAMPGFKNTPDAQKVKLIMEGKRVAHDDDDDMGGDGWGGCFGGSGGGGCF